MTSSATVEVGETFGATHRFTPDAVAAFSSSIGDDNPLHHDAALAARSRYGGLIVSGTHTTALLLGLTAQHFSKRASVVGVSFGVELRRAVPADAEVVLTWRVVAVSARRGGGQFVDLTGSLDDAAGNACVTATGRVLVGFEEAARP